jgi:hypothetical protein
MNTIDYTDYYHQCALKFIKEADLTATYMANIFNRKKAASAYSRSRESYSGTLDLTKLSFYKTRDDIFKSVQVVKDAKSHGIMMMIDKSGSMSNCYAESIDRVIELAIFCRKVNVPFVAYTFTSPNRKHVTPMTSSAHGGDALHLNYVSLVEIIPQGLDKNSFNNALSDLWISAHDSYAFGCREVEAFGGTPLNQALIIFHRLATKFFRRHATQKPTIIVVSDGEGDSLSTTVMGKREIRVTLEGNTVQLPLRSSLSATQILIESLRKVTTAKVICFYLFSKHTIRNNPSAYRMITNTWTQFELDCGNMLTKPAYGFDALIALPIEMVKAPGTSLSSYRRYGRSSRNYDPKKAFISKTTKAAKSRVFVNKLLEFIC